MHALFNFFASLRLTVVTLTLSLILVFVGTLAQVKMGLYVVQERYFSNLFIYWGPEGANWQIPVFPGGFLLGGLLMLNLVAAHLKRFTLTKKKAGIFIIHAGLIVLFLGQFATQLMQVESHMAIPEGGSRNYSESGRRSELAIIDVTDPKVDKVVSIPEALLAKNAKGGEIRHPDLPFGIKVHNYDLNSWFKVEGNELRFESIPRATKMDDKDVPAVSIEIVADGASKGVWTLSSWLTDANTLAWMKGKIGRAFPPNADAPRAFSYKDRNYLLMMRAERYYKPYNFALIDFSFDRYLGTEVAKNYSSKIRIERPDTGENREVLIYMNNPLRYGGETYYQGSFFKDESGTILQVMRNPSWLTPYIACVMVGLGLVIQFLGHLIGFAKKRTA